MTEILYTTAELSKIMQVGKSTIKRWTEEGKLRCFRTPGGHRKFRSSDINHFLTQFNYEVFAIDKIPPTPLPLAVINTQIPYEKMIDESCHNAARNNHRFIEKQLVGLYSAGNTLAAIFDSYLTPLLKTIVKEHSAGTLTTVELQIAKNTLIHALIFFTDTLPKNPEKNREMYCLTVNESLNEVELKAVELLLENMGIQVYNLGTVLTKYDAGDLVKQCKPDDVFVVISLGAMSFEIGQQLHELVEGVRHYGGNVYASNFYGAINVSETEAIENCRSVASYAEMVEQFSVVNKAVQ